MAKKIRFPLEMDNGVEVRSMEELREHFSLAKVLECLENGRLVTWLRDRYANDIADAVEALDQNDSELAKKVSEIFDVPYDEEALEKSKERAQRLKRLKEFTQGEQFLDKIDNVAFDQDELYDLLDEDKESIYLCGDRFTIPLSKAGVSYVGINNPTAVIDSKVEVDWEEKKISVEGVTFDEKYQDIVNRANAAREEIGTYSKKTYPYADRKILESMLPPTETESVQKMYDRAKTELENLNYDTDKNIVINNHLFEKDDDEEDEYDEDDNERVVDYKTVIENINTCIRRNMFFSYLFSGGMSVGVSSDGTSAELFSGVTISDTPLALIYDYQKCNDFAKVIMKQSKFGFTRQGKPTSLNVEKTIGTAQKFVELCRGEENVAEGYKFIFWALMIMTVDKSDEEEHLSLISDYAKMLCITEDEFEDLIRTVKIIYNREISYTETDSKAAAYQGGMRIVFSQDKVYCFRTKKVANIFEELFEFMSGQTNEE